MIINSLKYCLGFALLLGIIAGCAADQEGQQESTRSGYTQLTTMETGIAHQNVLQPTADLNIVEYLYYYNGSGVAIGDVDGDGLEDIFLGANQGADKLYHNLGELRFEEVSAAAGIDQDKSWTSGVSMADYNNDGHLDIYVCKVSIADKGLSSNKMYINDGNGNFKDQAPEMGLDFRGFSTQAAPIDYDKDGDLDIYLLNHTVHSVKSYGSIKYRTIIDTLAGDVLFENRLNEDGRFHNVSQEKGIYSSPLGYGLAVTTADFNQDGWVDIYVGNDFHENDYLYLNQEGKGFVESIKSTTGNTSQFSMGVDVGDINGDLLLDFFTTDMMPYMAEVALRSGGEDSDEVKRIKARLGYEDQQARNHLQINTGRQYWSDQAYMTGTYATDWSWSVLLEDYNNDGRQDIFISNGIVRRPNDLDYINYLNQGGESEGQEHFEALTEHMPEQPLKNVLFRQGDEGSFSAVKESLVGQRGYSTGAAVADLDRDGDMDIVVNNINSPSAIIRNDLPSSHWLEVDLEANTGSALHSVAIAYAGGQALYRQLHTVRGFQSSSTHRLHFGLGHAERVDSLVITWPDQKVQVVTDVQSNQVLTVKQDTALRRMAPQPTTPPSLAQQLPMPHQDEEYFDEVVDKLMPERLSTAGPAVLVEDLNGDGREDIFLGGGKANPAALLIGQRDGSFKPKPQSAFIADAKYDDVAVASIDFDNDGDRDLYVVSGGNEHKELDKLLEDRLYLNNGNDEFRRVPLSLPHTNGGVVAVADYDGDGYEDIFVGARSIPQAYGLVPYSFVLGNEKGRAVRIDLKKRIGMITDAVWVDVDLDDRLDLVAVGDWMAPTVFLQTDQGLANNTKDLGLDSLLGMWNSVTVADLNDDRRPDFLLGNLGLNHKWQASPEQPVKMYVGDFDQNGAAEPLIFFNYFGRYRPASGLDQLKENIPAIRKRFTDYKRFSLVETLDELHPGYDSLVVEHRILTELRSLALLSDSLGYTIDYLPRECQVTDVKDLLIQNDDLYLVGNSKSAVAQYGQQKALAGGIIRGYTQGQRLLTPLPLQPDGLPNSIHPMAGDRLLIGVNNGYPYLLPLK